MLSSELPADWEDQCQVEHLPAPADEDEAEEEGEEEEQAEEGDKDSNDNVAPHDTDEKNFGGDERLMADTTNLTGAERPGQELRQRKPTVSVSSGESRYGQIQLTFRYSPPRGKLIIVIHKCA